MPQVIRLLRITESASSERLPRVYARDRFGKSLLSTVRSLLLLAPCSTLNSSVRVLQPRYIDSEQVDLTKWSNTTERDGFGVCHAEQLRTFAMYRLKKDQGGGFQHRNLS